MEFTQFFETLANSPIVDSIVTFITSGGLATLAVLVLKLVINISGYIKTSGSSVDALKSALEELKAKVAKDEEVQKTQAHIDQKLEELSKMVKVLSLNATNPAVRQKALDLLLHNDEEKADAEELIVTGEIDIKTETEQELSELSAMMSHFDEKGA